MSAVPFSIESSPLSMSEKYVNKAILMPSVTLQLELMESLFDESSRSQHEDVWTKPRCNQDLSTK